VTCDTCCCPQVADFALLEHKIDMMAQEQVRRHDDYNHDIISYHDHEYDND
jgi:hypothetical protein